ALYPVASVLHTDPPPFWGLTGALRTVFAGTGTPVARSRAQWPICRGERPSTAPLANSSATQTQPLDQRPVALDVHLDQVVQQPAAPTDHQQQTTTRVV